MSICLHNFMPEHIHFTVLHSGCRPSRSDVALTLEPSHAQTAMDLINISNKCVSKFTVHIFNPCTCDKFELDQQQTFQQTGIVTCDGTPRQMMSAIRALYMSVSWNMVYNICKMHILYVTMCNSNYQTAMTPKMDHA